MNILKYNLAIKRNKMRTQYLSLSAFLLLTTLIVGSCKKSDPTADPTPPVVEGEKIAPDAFNFSTSKKVDINVRLLTNDGQPIKGVVMSLNKTNSSSLESSVFQAISDDNGYVKGSVNIPNYIDTLVIEPNYIGLISGARALISNNSINAVIGGANGYGGNVILKADNYQTVSKNNNQIFANTATSYVFANGQNLAKNVVKPSGKPTYLVASDAINATMLANINSTLREGIAVTNAALLNDALVSTLNVTTTSDVYMTYVYSEAGYSNSIGYYTYTTGTPPASAAAIPKVTWIFPNTKTVANGVVAGNKVKLGNFPANTTIAFVLLQNAWNGSTINLTSQKFYSTSAFNPETLATKKRHSVLMYDNTNKLFVLGLEDLLRDNGDDDFNDVVLYASSTATGGTIRTNGISSINVAPLVVVPPDADNDGVIDNLDEFPNDASRAITEYLPSKANWGTIAFEDNFPATGDYDMNDLVVKYRYGLVKSSTNKVVDIIGDFSIAAAGASYKNGFGVQFPFSGSIVSQVTGQKIIGSTIQLGANGLENGQSKAVIIPFDNTDALIKNADGDPQVNTREARVKATGDTAHVKITFTTPQTIASIGLSPFNPFLISNQRRGYEVHLPGFVPTDKMDFTLFGTEADNSNPSTGRYFKTTTNWPWALSFTETFKYPIELAKISDTYPHFKDWANSGNSLFTDWYSNTAVGYRQNHIIYSK